MGTTSAKLLGLAIITTLIAASAVSVASAGGSASAIQGCVGKQGVLRIVSSAKKCTAHEHALSWNERGPSGPAGSPAATAVYTLAVADTPANGSDTRTFLGKPATVAFNAKTVAIVSASLDFASSDGAKIDSFFEVCYQGATGPVNLVTLTEPNFSALSGSYFSQSVTGVVGGLAPGYYRVGVCTAAETGNVVHGHGAGWVEVAQTTAGVAPA
jgi:hypothetical protein